MSFRSAAENIPALLDTLLGDTTRVTLVDNAQTTSALFVEIAARQAKLAATQSLLVTTLFTPPATTSDRNLTVEEAAKLLGCTTQWLYRHAKTLPFSIKLSHRQLRFSEQGILRWRKMKFAS